MAFGQGSAFDQETLSVLRAVLDETWAALSPEHKASTAKSVLAESILKHAARGERDPARLRAFALTGIFSTE
jgi:hypothetical protein